MKSVWGLFVVLAVFFAGSDGQPIQYQMIRRICPSGSYHDPIKDRCRRVPGGGDMIRFNFDARCSGGFQGLLAHSKKSRFYFVCQRYAVLTCRCRPNERFDRYHLECTKWGKKLSKQDRKSSDVVDNIIEKYKCIDHNDDHEVYVPPTTETPVEETTFNYYTSFRKAIADFNMAWSASGSIEDTTSGQPKISWSTVATTTLATTLSVLPETTTIIPTTTSCGKNCGFSLGPLSFDPRPTNGPTPLTTTPLDYEDNFAIKVTVADDSKKVPVAAPENKKTVKVNPPEYVDTVDEKPKVEFKTILDKVLDKLVQRQNTTVKDMKEKFPDKIKNVKDKLNNFFNGTKDVENEDFVDYTEQENTQQAYMEAYYIYEFYDENDPDKVLWSEDANQTEFIQLETTTFRGNRTKITSLDGKPIRGDQEADVDSSDTETTSEEPSLSGETTSVGTFTTANVETTTEKQETTQSTLNVSDESSKESTVEMVKFNFPTPENLVTLPSTTLETTSQSVTSTETVPFTSTQAFTDAETTESTTFDTSTVIESKAVRFERASGEYSTLETTVFDSTTEGDTTVFTTTDYPTSLEAFKADGILSTTNFPEAESTTAGESTTITATLEEETSTVTSFNVLFTETTTGETTEEVNESTSDFTTLFTETSTQETTIMESYEMEPRIKAFHYTTDLTTTDSSTTDFETFPSTIAYTEMKSFENALETTTSYPGTSSEPPATTETSTLGYDEFGLTTTEGVQTESTIDDTASEPSTVPDTTTEILESFHETTTNQEEESSTVMPDVSSTTEDFDAPTTSTLMPDTPYTDISIEGTDSRALFQPKDTLENTTLSPTTIEFESTTAQATVSDGVSKSDPFGKLEQQPKEAWIEYYYVHDEYVALGDLNANMTEANNSSFKPKRDNSFEYYVESMSASREFNPRK